MPNNAAWSSRQFILEGRKIKKQTNKSPPNQTQPANQKTPNNQIPGKNQHPNPTQKSKQTETLQKALFTWRNH